MTEAEAKKIVAVLIASYPQARIEKNTAEIYERMIRDLDYPAVNASVEQLLATAKFLPTIAEIRERTAALELGERRNGGDGWGDVLRAIGKHGSYRSPGVEFEFADPVVAQCVEALSWRELCLSENQTADRARFIELYDSHSKTEHRKALSAGLPAMRRYELAKAARTGGASLGAGVGAVLRSLPMPEDA